MTESPPSNPLSKPPVKALIFDLMGTCLDWHTTVSPVLEDALASSASAGPTFNALSWRHAFFDEIHARFKAGLPQEDIDDTHRRTLLALLRGRPMNDDKIEACVNSWHSQTGKSHILIRPGCYLGACADVPRAWPDVTAALPILRSKYDVIVLANGTARLQVDITKSSKLDFDLLLSSELLGLTKPDPAIYQKAMELLHRRPGECVMVAAHAYDLKAAKEAGMRTVYVQRWTEDLAEAAAEGEGSWEEIHDAVREENDVYIDARMATSTSGGFLELAKMLDL